MMCNKLSVTQWFKQQKFNNGPISMIQKPMDNTTGSSS